MEFKLLENGIDSLEHALDFYERYLNYQDKFQYGHSELKMTIICLQNAVELLSKKALSKVDELLIYKEIKDEKILNLIKTIREERPQDSLDEYLIGYDVLTIEYNVLLKRVKNNFNLSNDKYQDLCDLGRLRNKVTHFGIRKPLDFHEVMGVINRTFDFVVEFFYPKFCNEMEDVRDRVVDIVEVGEMDELEAWSIFYYENLEKLNTTILKVCSDEEIIKAFEEKRWKFFYDGQCSEDGDISIGLENMDNPVERDTIGFLGLPRLNATVICGEGDVGPIYGVIDHLISRNNLFIYNKPYDKINYDTTHSRFWKDEAELFYRKELNADGVKDIFKLLITTL
jgi:hypothetical protein